MSTVRTIKTPRQKHAQLLRFISQVSDCSYNPRFTYEEARQFMFAYRCEMETGYSSDMAAARAYDCYAIHRAKGLLWEK